MYSYVGGDPVNSIDPTGLIDIYIGGMGDDSSRLVFNYYQRQRRAYPRRDIRYFGWDQGAGIANAISSAPRGEPINIIGHSLGGAEAIRASDRTNRTIDTLITIDPVDLPFDKISSNISLGNVKAWVNVLANPSESDRSDWIAWAGGKVDASVTDKADINFTSAKHHGEFQKMMDEINAARALEMTYRGKGK